MDQVGTNVRGVHHGSGCPSHLGPGSLGPGVWAIVSAVGVYTTFDPEVQLAIHGRANTVPSFQEAPVTGAALHAGPLKRGATFSQEQLAAGGNAMGRP